MRETPIPFPSIPWGSIAWDGTCVHRTGSRNGPCMPASDRSSKHSLTISSATSRALIFKLILVTSTVCCRCQQLIISISFVQLQKAKSKGSAEFSLRSDSIMAGLKRTDCATVDYVVSLIRGNTKAIVRQMMIASAYNGLVNDKNRQLNSER